MKSVNPWDIYKINRQKSVAVLCINNKLQEGEVKKEIIIASKVIKF